MLQYEDERLQYHGRQIVPVKVLTENTLKHMRKAQKQQAANPQKERDPDFDDLFLVELTHWFNKSFFEWVSMVPCKVCNDSTKGRRVSSIEQGLRVEVNICGFCRIFDKDKKKLTKNLFLTRTRFFF